MKKSKILWSLFSTIITTNCQSVDAASISLPVEGPVVTQNGQVLQQKSVAENMNPRARLTEAEALGNLNKIQQAEAIYSELISVDKYNPEVYEKRGKLYLSQHKYEQAAADFNTAILLNYKIGNKSTPTMDHLLATALVGKEDPEQAVSVLQPYLDNNTATVAMQETYMEAVFKTGAHKLVLEEAKRMWPNNEMAPVSVQKVIAESYLRLGKNEEALTSYQALSEKQPQDASTKASLAYALMYSGKNFEGLGLYDKLLQENPNMAGIFVEDAVGLLSQGNVLGGRSLFENIIAKYPDKTEYRQRYAEVLMMYNIERPAQEQYQQLAKAQNISETQERHQRYEKAIEMARKQQFPESLATLRWLHEMEPANHSITFDYVTVLHWAGNEDAAIKLYEQLPNVGIPDYVRQNMIDAYYNIGDYSKSLIALRSLSDRENRKNKLREAEILMRLGERSLAQAIYEELLSLDPRDIEVYLSRASLTDSMEAAWNLEQALRFIPQVPENEMRIRQIKADLAVEYIRMNQSTRAIPLLIPYINSNTASNSMQGNYIVALKAMGKYKLATVEAKRLWPDYTKAPLFALRTVAEAYIQLKEIPNAIALYRQIVAMTPDDVDDQRILAFHLMLDGKLIQGMAVYNQLVTTHPEKAALVVQDATLFLATEKYVMGKSLFELVINCFPNESLYRRQYADALAKNYLYQSAYKQYEAISHTPDFQVVGLTGMVKMALAVDDFKRAELVLETLKNNYGRSSVVAALDAQYDEHKQGRVDNYFSSSNSYKNTETNSWETTAEQHMNGNYWMLAGVGQSRFTDINADENQVMNSQSVGMRYSDLKQRTEFWYGKNTASTDFSTFRFTSKHSVSDELHITLEVSQSPIEDVQALNAVNGRAILARNYALTVSKNLSNRENMAIGLTRSLYSDGNQNNGYSLEHNYTLFTKGDDTLVRNLYWNRSWFAIQDLEYESPALRESMGAGWTLRRNVANGYWLGRFVANWDRDYPDSLAFNPYARLEYNHEFSVNHSLTLGAEYGLRTSNALGKGGFHYGHRQLDALYTITW